MSDCFLGEIRLFTFGFAPTGWVMCNGGTLQIKSYQALFVLLGTQFGGDGQNTFQVPDLRGRTPVGVNLLVTNPIQSGIQGKTGGVDSYALQATEAADHTHAVMGTSANAMAGRLAAAPTGTNLPAVTVPAGSSFTAVPIYVPSTPGNAVALAPGMVQAVGSAVPHENRQPYLAANYCIATMGMWPSHS